MVSHHGNVILALHISVDNVELLEPETELNQVVELESTRDLVVGGPDPVVVHIHPVRGVVHQDLEYKRTRSVRSQDIGIHRFFLVRNFDLLWTVSETLDLPKHSEQLQESEPDCNLPCQQTKR